MKNLRYFGSALITYFAPCLAFADQATLPDETTVAKKHRYTLKANSDSFDLSAEEAVLAWKEWHHQVGKLLTKRMNSAIGKTMGTVMLHITVDKDQSVTAQLLQSTGNPEFAQKSLAGAESLDKDASLKFPNGSKRAEVSFDASFKRNLLTLPGLKFIKNDYEHLN